MQRRALAGRASRAAQSQAPLARQRPAPWVELALCHPFAVCVKRWVWGDENNKRYPQSSSASTTQQHHVRESHRKTRGPLPVSQALCLRSQMWCTQQSPSSPQHKGIHRCSQQSSPIPTTTTSQQHTCDNALWHNRLCSCQCSPGVGHPGSSCVNPVPSQLNKPTVTISYKRTQDHEIQPLPPKERTCRSGIGHWALCGCVAVVFFDRTVSVLWNSVW